MCQREGVLLRKGMNFRLGKTYSVILMNVQPSAPYRDRIEENGRVIIYEGHDNPRPPVGKSPKEVDQELRNRDGSLTQNGLFYEAALKYKEGKTAPELVRVYEKIERNVWVYKGLFKLVDAWTERSGGRRVFKFRLELVQADH